jgi:hypothetical protein
MSYAERKNRILSIQTSPRTPDRAVTALERAVRPPHGLGIFGSGENRYKDVLAEASEIVVTSDSVSMLSDALARDVHDDAPAPARKRSAPASGSGTRSSTVASPAESTKRQTDNRWRPLEQRLGTSIPDMLRNLPIWIWIAVSLLLVAVVIALVVSTSDEVETTTGESTVVNVEAAAAVQDSMVLRAEVVDTAWISLTADGTSSYQAVLLRGTSARWSAMERFEISMGNAGGVVFYRVDVRLPAFAGPKQSVRKVVVTMHRAK